MNFLAGLFLFAVFSGLAVVGLGLLLQYPVLIIPAVIVGVFLCRRYARAKAEERELFQVQEPEPDYATERKAARVEHMRKLWKR